MYLHLWRETFKKFRKRAIQAQEVRIRAPVLLLPYLDINVVEDANIPDRSNHVGEVARDLVFLVVGARRCFQYPVIYCVGVDAQVKAA